MLTINDTYPLPRIDALIDMMAGKTYVSTLHCFSGWDIALGTIPGFFQNST
jgi:hypothetical protein